MRKTLLIATLSLCAFAWAHAADFSCCGGQDYNQTVATQAQQNSLAKLAIAQSAALSGGSENSNAEQPGSIASNSGEDFYNQTVAAQAQLNSLIKAAFTQSGQGTILFGRETASLAEPASMASDEGMQSANEDFYSQKVEQQADLNSNFLESSRLQASVQPEGWNGSEQPGSMASDAGSPSTSGDFYGQTIAIQSNANRMLQDSNRQQ